MKFKLGLLTSVLVSVIIVIILVFFLNRSGKALVNIESQPTGSVISINSRQLVSPAKVYLKPGKYEISALKKGYTTAYQSFKVVKGRRNNITIRLMSDQFIETSNYPGSPLVTTLPYLSEHFQIYWDEDLRMYEIVPIINIDDKPFNQVIKEQWDKYEQYAREGYDWLKSNDSNASKDVISFWGEEWWPEGKSISL